jgi:hypothetical protein
MDFCGSNQLTEVEKIHSDSVELVKALRQDAIFPQENNMICRESVHESIF